MAILRLRQRLTASVFLDLNSQRERQLAENVAVQFHLEHLTTLAGIVFHPSRLLAASRRAPANEPDHSASITMG